MNSSAWLDWIRPSSTRHLPYEWVSMISMNWNLVCRVTMVRAMACMCPSTGVVVSKNHLYWSVAMRADQLGVVATGAPAGLCRSGRPWFTKMPRWSSTTEARAAPSCSTR